MSELSLLVQATRALAGTLDLDRLAGRLTELARTRLGAHAAGVWLLERNGAVLTLRGAAGLARPEVVARLAQPPEADVLGWITGQAGPVVLRRLPQDARPEARPWLEAEGVRSGLAVPLVADAPVGALLLFRREGRAFTRADLGRAEVLCLPAAPAIVGARLHAEQVARAEGTELLLATAQALGGTLHLPTVLDAVVDAVVRVSGAQQCAVLELDPTDGRLHVRAQRGLRPEDWPRVSLALGQGAAGRAALTRAPFFSADVERVPLPMDDLDAGTGLPLRDLVRRERRRAALGLPLISQDTVLGAVAVFWAEPHEPDERVVRLLAGVAQHAAVAIEQARLYEDAQRALTELRAMQRKLVQVETLRALGELAGGAAHHLNNLLTIVVGRIQLLRRTVADERLARPLEIVERAARDGAEVVRRLQQFAGMRRTAEPRLVDLGQVVRDVVEMTRGRWQDAARAQGVEITVDARVAPLPAIPGDATALREMLTNLVLNAVDALPRGGRLTVEAAAVEGQAVLSVTDDGVGMPEEVRQRAHEPFFTTKGVKATGLGLSVAFGVARRHGGEVTVQSEAGRGTTVRVTLPLPAGGAPPSGPLAAPPGRPLRIVLVDDEAEVREALAEMLALRGHTVVAAGGGGEALRLIEADPSIDLLLTDLVMPAMTGWEVAAAAKARRPRLLVGLVTGWGEVPDATSGAHPAVDFVLAKPVTLEALDHAVAGLGRA